MLLGIALVAGCNQGSHPVASGPSGPVEPGASPTVHLTTLPTQGFTTAWRGKVSFVPATINEVHAVDDYVFVYTKLRGVEVFNARSGKFLYGATLCEERHDLHPPIVLKDWVVYPTLTALKVYDRKGAFLRSLVLKDAIRSDAVGDLLTVYYSQASGRIAAVSTDHQPYSTFPKWEAMPATPGGFTAAPAYHQGFIFAGGRNGYVYGMRASDGEAAWTRWRRDDWGFATGGAIRADLAADGSGVYAVSADSKLYCLDINTGLLRWAWFSQEELKEGSHPILTIDTIYLWTPRQGIVAIDKGSGDLTVRKARWNLPQARQFLSQDERMTYLAAKDNTVLAVDRKSGQVVYTSQRKDFVAFATNRKDAVIYAVTTAGEVLAIRPITTPGRRGELVLNDAPAHLR